MAKKAAKKLEEAKVVENDFDSLDDAVDSNDLDFDTESKDPEEKPSGLNETDTESDFDNSLVKAEDEVKNLQIKLKDVENNYLILQEKLKSLHMLEESDQSITSRLGKLFELIKDERQVAILDALQTNYLALKYKTYSEEDKKKLQEKIAAEFMREDFEGKVSAVKRLQK